MTTMFKDHERMLMAISRETHEVVKAIDKLGDDLFHLQLMVKTFSGSPPMKDGGYDRRTLKEWLQHNQFILTTLKTHQLVVGRITGFLEKSIEEEPAEKSSD
jgi:hypothetical protein